MKTLLSMILFIFISQATWAARLPPRDSLLASSLEQYQQILSGWFINKHCQFINDEESKKLEKNLATIASKFRKDLGDSKQLSIVLANAKKVPLQDPLSACTDTAKKQLDSSIEQAQSWSDNIRNYQPRKTPDNLKALPEDDKHRPVQ